MADELTDKTATELTALIRKRQVSSRELVAQYLARIERSNAKVNAIVTLDAEGAHKRAAELDEQLARSGPVGPLHGLPMTIKDAYEVAGMRSTAGAEELKTHVPLRHAVGVQRLVDAGAVILGKSNVPLYSADFQTYNSIFGTSNNPHDLTRTPGGSSGGAVAALACGFCALEFGSDIGGSIRNPANWTGVYGHKPSHGVVPLRGHMPGPPGTRSEGDLAVGGPLARSAEDLALELDVLAGPDTAKAIAWKLSLPPPRHKALSDYRIAVWLDDPACRVDSAVGDVLQSAVDALAKAGAKIDDRARPDMTFAEMSENYQKLLNPIMVAGMPSALLDALAQMADKPKSESDDDYTRFSRMAMARHTSWLRENERRARYRVRWAEFFERFDVLLCPVSVVPAIPHDQQGAPLQRTITVNGETRPYLDLLGWASLATPSYLPATVPPVGRTRQGLPVGAQLIGPYLEDRTTIDLAMRMANLVGGFVPPAGL